MSEWLKEHAWKACRVARLSQVRILSLPPGSKDSILKYRVFTFLQEKDRMRTEVRYPPDRVATTARISILKLEGSLLSEARCEA